MIFDRLNNIAQYKNPALKKGFEFLLNNDLKNLADGRYDITDGIYANVQTIKAKQLEDMKWEAHRKYLDIQYVIKGKEKMGYGILEDFETTICYDNVKDVEFLDGKTFNFVDVNEGDFVIFYPNDVHAPMLYAGVEDIKKVIVKVDLELL